MSENHCKNHKITNLKSMMSQLGAIDPCELSAAEDIIKTITSERLEGRIIDLDLAVQVPHKN